MAINITLRSPIKFGNFLPEVSTQQALTNAFNSAFLPSVASGFNYGYEGTEYVEKGYNKNADVYSIVSQISRKFASVPGYTSIGDKEAPNPLPKPNYYQSDSEFKELWETFMLLTGNAYQWMLRPEEGANAGKPLARFLLPSHLMKIVLKKKADISSLESPIDHYALIVGQVYIKFEEKDVIHSKFPNPNYDLSGSHLYGRSPLAAGMPDVQTENVTKDNNIKTMQSGGAYGFIHAKDGQTPWTKEQADEAKSRLQVMSASDSLLGRIDGASAPMGFTKISVDTTDLQPFEYLKYSQKQLCNVFGWSDLLLNNDAKYDNINAVWKMAISNRISPDLKIYEEGLNSQFYPHFKTGIQVYHDVSELPEMQEDMKALSEWVFQGVDRGVFSRNEAREFLKMKADDRTQMNDFTVISAVVPIEDIDINDPAVDKSFRLD